MSYDNNLLSILYYTDHVVALGNGPVGRHLDLIPVRHFDLIPLADESLEAGQKARTCRLQQYFPHDQRPSDFCRKCQMAHLWECSRYLNFYEDVQRFVIIVNG